MKAMILAAGRGTRLKPYTDNHPKALFPVNGEPLIERLVRQLASAGFKEIIVNLAYRGEQIRDALGDGSKFGVSISYSDEGDEPLETGGGIVNALPMLGDETFLVVNGDIYTDYPFAGLLEQKVDALHMIMVKTPDGESGDFYFTNGKLQTTKTADHLRVAGIVLYPADFFQGCRKEKFSVLSLWREAIARNEVTAEFYHGTWFAVDTPERVQRAIKSFDCN